MQLNGRARLRPVIRGFDTLPAVFVFCVMETERDGRPSQTEALGLIGLTFIVVVGLFIFARPKAVESYAALGDSLYKNEMFVDIYVGADPTNIACLLNIHSDDLNHPGVSTKGDKNGGSITLTGQTVDYQLPKPGSQLIVVNGKEYDLTAYKFLDAHIDANGQLTITQKPLDDTDARAILHYLTVTHGH